MNTKALANLYTHLTAEERFRLIVAAGDRGDDVEQERLQNASPRITFSNKDYSPFGHALQELAILVFIEVVNEAAACHSAFERWNIADLAGIIAEMNSNPAAAEEKSLTCKDGLSGRYMAQGFMLRTKAAGWRLFCERMGISPFGTWRYLPGFDRLLFHLNIVEGTPGRPGAAYSPKSMVCWMNSVRPSGDPEVTEADIITADRFADDLDATYRNRIKWYGGD